MTDSDQIIITATMLGYMAGLAERQNANPYSYMQTEAWSWQHGYEQGRMHRARSMVRDIPAEPVDRTVPKLEWLESKSDQTLVDLTKWMMQRMHRRNHVRTHEWAKNQLADKTT